MYHYNGPTGQRTASLQDVVNLISANPSAEHYVWQEGWSDWKYWKQVPEINAFFDQRPSPPVAPAVPPAAPHGVPHGVPHGGYAQQPGAYTRGYPGSPPQTFGSAISTCWKKYATFDGRASRSEYWWFILFFYLTYLTCIGPLVLMIPMLAVTVRRLHDSGRSGWWILLGSIPYLNIITGIFLLVFLLQDSQPHRNQYG